jgi:copper homeostasis protein
MARCVRERISIEIVAMIRPRPGDFCYSDDEFNVMKRDIENVKALKVDGVALGVLTAQGAVDRERTKMLVDLARPLAVTFHRAIDECHDLMKAMDDLKSIGVARVLTSGGKAVAQDGVSVIAELVQRSGKSLKVMVGGGVDFKNVGRIMKSTKVEEIHVLTAVSTEIVQDAVHSSFHAVPLKRITAPKVREMVELLEKLASESRRTDFA